MAQVSKRPIRKEVVDRMYEILYQTVKDLKTDQEIKEFLDDFLSPVERIMLAKRLAIALLLTKGYRYETIAYTLKVTPPTIAAVAISLRYTGRGYKRVAEKILRQEKIKDFLDKIDDVIADSVPAGKGPWMYLARRQKQSRAKRRKAL